MIFLVWWHECYDKNCSGPGFVYSKSLSALGTDFTQTDAGIVAPWWCKAIVFQIYLLCKKEWLHSQSYDDKLSRKQTNKYVCNACTWHSLGVFEVSSTMICCFLLFPRCLSPWRWKMNQVWNCLKENEKTGKSNVSEDATAIRIINFYLLGLKVFHAGMLGFFSIPWLLLLFFLNRQEFFRFIFFIHAVAKAENFFPLQFSFGEFAALMSEA